MFTILSRRAVMKAGGLGLMAIAGLKPSQVFAEILPAEETFTLPPLPYAFNALEPYIDAKTMEIHHDKHHAAYVKNLNDALKTDPKYKGGMSIAALLEKLDTLPEGIRTTVKNNGGGHANHSLFWTIMKPSGGGEPTGAIAKAIEKDLGGFPKFKETFSKAAATRFGSGWAWLTAGKGGKLAITSSANQDSPLLEGLMPVLGLDVWEHAYYLKYQNRRPEYVAAWWNTINWDEVNRRYSAV
jgi:Fe-Mn family superoxide dismutase